MQAEGAKSVTVRWSSRVGGSIQAVQGWAAAIVDGSIDGSIQLNSNRRALRMLNNSVGADVRVFQNTGGAEISDNRIDGNLQCTANVPKPTGSGNTVPGGSRRISARNSDEARAIAAAWVLACETGDLVSQAICRYWNCGI